MDPSLVDQVHRAAFVADAHADSLMWNRDLTVRSERGDVDFPRLVDGGVKLQCFTVVTRGLPVVDGFALNALVRGWPLSALRDDRSRADWQIAQLERFCAASQGKASIVKLAPELVANCEAGRLSCVLGLEGARALRGDVAAVEAFWKRGVRFISLTHLMHNALGGASFPLARKGGITGYGREVLAEMTRLNMAVDIAHASTALVEDLLSQSTGPIFCSHTGIGSVRPLWRNLPDQTLRAVAARGGVICVIFAVEYLGGRRMEDLVRHLERALEVAGENHVGLGSDFDGLVRLPRPMRDVRDLRLVTGALLERGIDRGVVAKVLGGNLRRFLEEQVFTVGR